MSDSFPAGYKITAHLYSNGAVTACHGVRLADETPVTLLTGDMEAVRGAFLSLSKVTAPGLPELIDLLDADQPTLVLARIVGEPASAFAGAKDVDRVMRIAFDLARLLARLHESALTYSSLAPETVGIEPDTNEVTVFDFVNDGESVSPFSAPEQLGLLPRVADERADLYRFGALLYYLLSGKPPFSPNSPDLKAKILFESPDPITREDVPEDIIELVSKQLAKAPEDRSRSSKAMASRIGAVLSGSDVEPERASSAFHVSQRIYGRADELNRLQSTLESVRQGHGAFLSITGPSGIGKTVLVRNFAAWAIASGTTLIEGRFDSMHRESPYFGLSQAFEAILEIVSNDDAMLRELEEEMSDSYRVLASLAPGSRHIFPESDRRQAEIRPASNVQVKMLRTVLSIVASRDRPILLYFDDIHCADSASADVLLDLAQSHLPYVLTLVTWRSDDDREGAAADVIRDLIQSIGAASTIALDPLDEAATINFVRDSLDIGTAAEEVGSILYAKTLGAPYFVSQLLQESVRDEAIWYDEGEGRWQWDRGRLESRAVSENVGDILVREVNALDSELRSFLVLASCSRSPGRRLSLVDLLDGDEAYVRHCIYALRRLRLLQGEGDSLSFAHERVHEAVYAQLSDDERSEYHDRIVQAIEARADREAVDLSIRIADQYRLMPDLVYKPAEARLTIATVFLGAGRQATGSNAFDSALEYLTRAIEVLGENLWSGTEALTSELFELASDAAYLSGDLEAADEYSTELIAHSTIGLRRANAFRIQMKVALARGEFEQALARGHSGLEELGHRLPRQVSKWRAALTLRWMVLWLKFALPSDLDPESRRSAESHAAALLLANMVSVASGIGDPRIALYISKMLRISIADGDSGDVVSALCFLAVSLKAFFGDIDEAYRLSKKARSLSANPGHEVTNTTLLDGWINCWKEPIADTGQRLVAAFHKGIDTEDVEVAITAGLQGGSRLFFVGVPLDELQDIFDELRDASVSLEQRTLLAEARVYCQAIRNLEVEDSEPWMLTGEFFNERAEDIAEHNAMTRANFYLVKAYIATLWNDREAAASYIEAVGPSLPAIVGLPLFHTYYFIECLALLRSPLDEAGRQRLSRQLGKLKTAARDAPMNFYTRCLLIEAEVAHLEGDDELARACYLTAATQSSEAGLLSDSILINESMAHSRLFDAEALAGQTRQLHSRWRAAATRGQIAG
ncbi:MAG: AAA family ATPase [Gammaproteobacteria bacterium]|nr:AAA family ATPase [Gammaproteobacteria bacterium]